jgi:hypothetical protein
MDALEVFPLGAPARIRLTAGNEPFSRLQHKSSCPDHRGRGAATLCLIIC